MNKRIAYVYLPPKFSDWEPAFITPALLAEQFYKKGASPSTVKTFALTKEPVISMGGLSILPDFTVEGVTTENAALLLLPGSDTWLDSIHDPVLEKVRNFLSAGIPVAAICGATLALGKAGILDNCVHTSNALALLKSACPEYKGEINYRNELAVTDKNLITANGTAPLEFAYHILKRLDVFNAETLDAWYKLYQTHDPQYYFKLVQSLESNAGLSVYKQRDI